RKGGVVPYSTGQSPRAAIAAPLGGNPEKGDRHRVLAGITPNSPGAGTGPASCGRPRTRPFYASISALCGALSASRARARAPASHRVWHAIWGPARACNKVRAGTDRTGFASKSLRIRRDPPTRFAPDLGSRRV